MTVVRAPEATRTAELREALTRLKSELQQDIDGRIREGRVDRVGEVVDMAEGSEAASREALDLVLLEMRANTISSVDSAIARLDAGKYGFCFECERPIAVRRLRALPFAVRCVECEEDRADEPHRTRPYVEGRMLA